MIAKFKKEPTTATTVVVIEALKIAPQLPLEYYKYTIYSALFSSLSRLLSYIQIANYNKVYYEHCEKKFDSNNKLYKHLYTCFATKKFSNTDIAINKKGVDRIATTVIVVVTKMSLPASQLAT